MIRSEQAENMVKPAAAKTKSVAATLDFRLAERLDAYCAKNRLSRSQGIAHAIEQFLEAKLGEASAEFRKRAVNS
jgi:metal-responsive CopG/Arc/MetJ family transcriptional regulator